MRENIEFELFINPLESSSQVLSLEDIGLTGGRVLMYALTIGMDVEGEWLDDHAVVHVSSEDVRLINEDHVTNALNQNPWASHPDLVMTFDELRIIVNNVPQHFSLVPRSYYAYVFNDSNYEEEVPIDINPTLPLIKLDIIGSQSPMRRDLEGKEYGWQKVTNPELVGFEEYYAGPPPPIFLPVSLRLRFIVDIEYIDEEEESSDDGSADYSGGNYADLVAWDNLYHGLHYDSDVD